MHWWWCGFWWWALGLEDGPAWLISSDRSTHLDYLLSATSARPNSPTTPCITHKKLSFIYFFYPFDASVLSLFNLPS